MLFIIPGLRKEMTVKKVMDKVALVHAMKPVYGAEV
jgi:hypothetical protein